jgi:hypothetical protein
MKTATAKRTAQPHTYPDTHISGDADFSTYHFFSYIHHTNSSTLQLSQTHWHHPHMSHRRQHTNAGTPCNEDTMQ